MILLLVSFCLGVSKRLLTLNDPRIETQIVFFQQRQTIESALISALAGNLFSLNKRLANSTVVLTQSLFFPTVFVPRPAGSGLNAPVIASVVEKSPR
ncbi:Uncharacterised protein [Salmonella bongori]|nr:Uncharacterised protein [Salmonella bongori]